MPPKKWPFTQAMVAHAPEDPGVFLLWEGDECIYIGHARRETIRAALLRHMEAVSGACTKAATHYSWEITIWPAARETQLLAEFLAKHRREPRCQQKTD